MKEYIERNELLNRVDEYCGNQRYLLSENMRDIISSQPVADVKEIIHAKWINDKPYTAMNGKYLKTQECSNCHALFVSDGNEPYSNHPYCCECGAQMDL